jgi:hypothetical protein
MGVGSQCYAPAALHQGESPSTLCTGGWVGARVGLDGVHIRRENLLPALVFVPWTILSLVSCCTDSAILGTLLPFIPCCSSFRFKHHLYICFTCKYPWNNVMLTWKNCWWVYIALFFEPASVLIEYVCKHITMRLVGEMLLIVNAAY